MRDKQILTLVCRFYGINYPALIGDRKYFPLADARLMSIYLLKKYLGYTYEKVGEMLNISPSNIYKSLTQDKWQIDISFKKDYLYLCNRIDKFDNLKSLTEKEELLDTISDKLDELNLLFKKLRNENKS